MKTTSNELPWQDSPDVVACNRALGHLVENLPRHLKIDGRINAEVYLSAVGAIAGYAAQRTLFAASPPVEGVNITRVGVMSGDLFWFGDALNVMLVPETDSESNRCVWPLALGGATSAGLEAQQVPSLADMFRHVSATLGGAEEGRSSVPARHRAQVPARQVLKAVWPLAIMCFSGKFPGADRDFGAAPVAWWSAIAAQASNRPVQDVRSVVPPDIAITILMESAIYCSKLDQSSVETT